MCESITGVTSGYRNSQVSHVGILQFDPKLDNEEGWQIIEAIGDHVQSTPLSKFLERSPEDKNGKKKIMVGRIKAASKETIRKAVAYARKQIDKPYDQVFHLGEEAFYCSELIYFAFGQELFSLNPMSFSHPVKTQVHQGWVDYFENIGAPAPEGEMGINPGAMSRHADQEIIAIYGVLDNMRL